MGNPTASEVSEFRSSYKESFEEFCERTNLEKGTPVIAVLAGSRRQEIKDNLPTMLQVAAEFKDYQLVIAGAPGIDDDYYAQFVNMHHSSSITSHLIKNQTYALLSHAHAALVTSGTATLETALFRVPQVVCYRTVLPKFIGYMRKKVLKVKYVSLVNLVANREVVTELVADGFTPQNIRQELLMILDGPHRQDMLQGYEEVAKALGTLNAPDQAAYIIVEKLKNK